MRAMILAAGLGTRMRPLTETVPKPLLPVGGKPLLAYHLENLVRNGIGEVVINHSRFGDRIEAAFGSNYSGRLRIRYSAEGDIPLDTGGGIRNALPLLGDMPFLLVNGDVWTDMELHALTSLQPEAAHLVMVPNPPYHAGGDFALQAGRLKPSGTPMFTYSGIGVFHPRLFSSHPAGVFPLAPLLRRAMQEEPGVTGQLYRGRWEDVGTPERLAALNRRLQ